MACAMASMLALGAAEAQAANARFAPNAITVDPSSKAPLPKFGPFKKVVVIYQENHSFDNLYGGWGSVGSDAVNGWTSALLTTPTQIRQNGALLNCVFQNDVNLAAVTPQSCNDNGGSPSFTSAFVNLPFNINTYIPSTATTCPPPSLFAANGVLAGSGLPGGCTRDIVHRYYNEIFQIDQGKQDRYVLAADAQGLSLGYYDTTQLPLYKFLHTAGSPNYVVADNFFQGAFGGSFLNHQWLVAGATPVWAGSVNDGSSNDLHSVLDSNGMASSTFLYANLIGSSAKDQQETQSCSPGAGRGPTQAAFVCGDYAVNTTQPFYQPYSPGTILAKRLPPLTNATIGDKLSAAGVGWAWYSGGWSNADGDVGAPGWTNGLTKGKFHSCTDPNVNATAVYPNCPDYLFQFHHQAFNYFAAYAPGTAARKQHLRDEAEFIGRADNGNLLAVSFVKPIGEDNEHPGYGSDSNGENHLVNLLKHIFNGPDGAKTLVIITYDEFGGQWDHVPPPGFGGEGGAHDVWGPGTRIPAMLISKQFTLSAVDHAEHDTTSIAATLETMFGLTPLGPRDATVGDLFDATMARALGF
jgi:phospholipase C